MLKLAKKWESYTYIMAELDIEWDKEALVEYIDSTWKAYYDFLQMSDSLIKAFIEFVNDENHTGIEADSAKAFISEREIPMLEQAIAAVQDLMDKENALLDSFAEDLDSSAVAKLKTSYLEKVKRDFKDYTDVIRYYGKRIRDTANELNDFFEGVPEIGAMFTVPDERPVVESLEELVSEDGLSGIIPNTIKKIEQFDEDHKLDIENSAFKELLSLVENNLKDLMKE